MSRPKFIHSLDELPRSSKPPMPKVKPPKEINLVRDEVTIYQMGYDVGYRAGIRDTLINKEEVKQMDKYLSIITNFGCHFTCPYCLTKKTGIDIPKTTINGLDFLEFYLDEYDINIVSVSGGGDPLHGYEIGIDNFYWYGRLFYILNRRNIRFELHTSYVTSEFFDIHGNECYRVVYHLRDYKQLESIKRYGDEIVRVVFVVAEDMTKEDIDKIADYCKNSDVIDELSFRQMIDENYQTTFYHYDYLKENHKTRWYYIEQGDYNLYYCENNVFRRFEDMRGGAKVDYI